MNRAEKFRPAYLASWLTAAWYLTRARIAVTIGTDREIFDRLVGDQKKDLSKGGENPELNSLVVMRDCIASAAHRLPWQNNCLVMALAARKWLDREGIASTTRLGTKSGGKYGVYGHVWVEVGGFEVTSARHSLGFAPIFDSNDKGRIDKWV